MASGSVVVPDILARIIERKTEELAKAVVSIRELEQRANEWVRRSFYQSLKSKKPAIIAEIKKASPSRGVLAPNFDPAVIAAQYEAGGAAAISVLTDRYFFQGSLSHLQMVRNASGLPLLRKDFTTAEYHVVEAAGHGADAILLIAAILDPGQLRALRCLAESFDMDALVEVHDETELERALESGARIIGVNNRDLRTFEVRLETSLRLAERIPAGILRVAESGIFTSDHIRELSAYHAFLVGESLMRSDDPVATIRELCS